LRRDEIIAGGLAVSEAALRSSHCAARSGIVPWLS
jgi:hypothetical protein